MQSLRLISDGKVWGFLEAARYVDEPSDYVLSELVSYQFQREVGGISMERRLSMLINVRSFDQAAPDVSRVLLCLRICARAKGEFWHQILALDLRITYF